MDDVKSSDMSVQELNTRVTFWTTKHVATNLVLLALASIAAYLQYYLYPLIMSRAPDSVSGLGFGETDITLKFSLLTFQYTSTRCDSFSCTRLVGIPAFDFFQAIIIALVIINLFHFLNVRKVHA
jgi:hypothetical protein